MRVFLTVIILFLGMYANSAFARWAYVQKDVQGDRLTYAEKTGKAGGILRVVCTGKEFHFQIAMPQNVKANQTSLTIRVDTNRERMIAGSILRNEAGIPIFVGKDWRGEPAVGMKQIIRDMKEGSRVIVSDSVTGALIDSFPLKGLRPAFGKAYRKCS